MVFYLKSNSFNKSQVFFNTYIYVNHFWRIFIDFFLFVFDENINKLVAYTISTHCTVIYYKHFNFREHNFI